MALPDGDIGAPIELITSAAAGDARALGQLWTRHEDRLRRLVALRLDRRLQGRVDPADVLQEAFITVAGRIAEFAAQPTVPFFVWLRFLTIQKLAEIHRHHLGVQQRQADREVSLQRPANPQASSQALAAQLLGQDTTPSLAAVRAERRLQIEQALERLDNDDREIVALRHFEQLSNAECAQVLGLQESAASKRYIRAMARLQDALRSVGGAFTGDGS